MLVLLLFVLRFQKIAKSHGLLNLACLLNALIEGFKIQLN
jgi:hypothetical protein